MQKRKYVYLKPPSHYSISACACGNRDTQWSEFEEHIWCEKCNIDFKPTDNGVFGIPLGQYAHSMFGISFHRLNLQTNEIEGFVSAGFYVKTINFLEPLNLDQKLKVSLISMFKEDDLKSIDLDLKDFSLDNSSITKELNQTDYNLYLMTISHDKTINEWELNVERNDDKFYIVKNEKYQKFVNFFINQKLQKNLPFSSENKSNKI